KIYKLLDFTERGGSIADPWYSGDFEATYRDVVEGIDGLYVHIMSREGGK
ncbi:MAG: low molecular weight phosphotyrosine protein phosphatase, partial [Lachnospiraceae bacterium]|nr:low molecular weight phosphotyrosine protein phosphatase [Lachnospiraceae bacterium]MDD3660442.1 low molecular weight phosphotyrosine protein phosphatase [Lachnospiraceae bacterium]